MLEEEGLILGLPAFTLEAPAFPSCFLNTITALLYLYMNPLLSCHHLSFVKHAPVNIPTPFPPKRKHYGFFVFARVLNSSVLYSVQRDGEWRCHLASVVQHIGLYFQIHAWFPEPASPDDSQGGHKADHLSPFSQSLHDIPLSVAPCLVKAISQIPSAFCLLAIISQPSQSPEEPAGKPVYLVSHLEPVSQNPIISWRNPIFTPSLDSLQFEGECPFPSCYHNISIITITPHIPGIPHKAPWMGEQKSKKGVFGQFVYVSHYECRWKSPLTFDYLCKHFE